VLNFAFGLCRGESATPLRVALMDFYTDDNSYRSNEMFSRFDTNRDSSLNAAELQKMAAEIQKGK